MFVLPKIFQKFNDKFKLSDIYVVIRRRLVLKLNLTGTTASALASYICMTTVWSKLLCQGDVQFRFQTIKLSTTDASGIDPTNFTNTGLSTCYFDPEVTVPTFK